MQEPTPFEATLRFASALVQDGMTGVTVIVPRRRGVLTFARGLAEAAGVTVSATEVGSTHITMRFSSQRRTVTRKRTWARLLSWRTG